MTSTTSSSAALVITQFEPFTETFPSGSALEVSTTPKHGTGSAENSTGQLPSYQRSILAVLLSVFIMSVLAVLLASIGGSLPAADINKPLLDAEQYQGSVSNRTPDHELEGERHDNTVSAVSKVGAARFPAVKWTLDKETDTMLVSTEVTTELTTVTTESETTPEVFVAWTTPRGLVSKESTEIYLRMRFQRRLTRAGSLV